MHGTDAEAKQFHKSFPPDPVLQKTSFTQGLGKRCKLVVLFGGKHASGKRQCISDTAETLNVDPNLRIQTHHHE